MTPDQIVATIVFAITFVMVLSDRVDRTIVAMAGAAVMVAGGHVGHGHDIAFHCIAQRDDIRSYGTCVS